MAHVSGENSGLVKFDIKNNLKFELYGIIFSPIVIYKDPPYLVTLFSKIGSKTDSNF